MASQDSAAYEPTYRQVDVDETLDDHENRITRLEKVAIAVVGYGLAEGSNIVTDLLHII